MRLALNPDLSYICILRVPNTHASKAENGSIAEHNKRDLMAK